MLWICSDRYIKNVLIILAFYFACSHGQKTIVNDHKTVIIENDATGSWQHAKDHCNSLNRQLCSYKKLCTEENNFRLKSKLSLKTEMWSPILDEYNDWVFLSRQRPCSKLSEQLGPPSWSGYNCSTIRDQMKNKQMENFCSSKGKIFCCQKQKEHVYNIHPVPVFIKSRVENELPYYSFYLSRTTSEENFLVDNAAWRNGGRLEGDLLKFALMSGFVKGEFEIPIFFCNQTVTTATRLKTTLHKISMKWCSYPWELNFYLYASLTKPAQVNTNKLVVGQFGKGDKSHTRISLDNNNSEFETKYTIFAPNYVEDSIIFSSMVKDACRAETEVIPFNSGIINSPKYPNKYNRHAISDIECKWKIGVQSKNVIRLSFKVIKLAEDAKVPFSSLQQFRTFQSEENSYFNFNKACNIERIEITDPYGAGYGTICGSELPPTFYTTSNAVNIHFFGKKASIGISFSLFYKSIPPPNGLIITKLSENGLTWQEAKQKCEESGKTLCSAEDICSLGRPFYGVEKGDKWAPINNEYNDWVQIGRGNIKTCRRHNAVHGPPQWGVIKGNCQGINISNPCPTKDTLYCCHKSPGEDELPQSKPVVVKILFTVQNGIVFSKYIREGTDAPTSYDPSKIWSPARKQKGDFTTITLRSHYHPGIEQVVYFCSMKTVPAIGQITRVYSIFLQPCETKGWRFLYALYSLKQRQKDTYKYYIGVYNKWPYHSRVHFRKFPDGFQRLDSFLLFSFSADVATLPKDNHMEEDNACNDNTLVIIAPSIVISPGYPAAYGNNLHCRWHIKLPEKDYQEGNRMRITIQELHLEDPVDVLTVYEVASTIDLGKTSFSKNNIKVFKSRKDYTGMVSQTTLETYDTFFLLFTTDNSASGKGFKLLVETLNNNCGGGVVTDGQEITSPNYPHSYSGGLVCLWTIKAPTPDHKIEIKFQNLDLGRDENCSDYLNLVGGKSTKEWLLCSSQNIPTKILFNESVVNITFKTMAKDKATIKKIGKGFSLRVFFLLDGTVDNEEQQQCGIQHVSSWDDAQDRIVNGRQAKRGSFPWVVMIGRPTISCGGSLLNERWVLTAAHCIVYEYIAAFGIMVMHEQIDKYRVIAGRYERNKPSPGEQIFNISRVYMHAEYKRYNVRWRENGVSVVGVFPYNDIILLRLSRKAQFSSTISPICLPTQDTNIGEFCYVAGWGSMTESSVKFVSALHYAKVPILDNSLCNSWEELEGTVMENSFCAGYPNGGNDHCWGDSGGPLMCRGRYGNFYINGIVSWSRKCGGKRTPGVYTRVWPFYDWINKLITT